MIIFPQIVPSGPDVSDWSDLIDQRRNTGLLYHEFSLAEAARHCPAQMAYLATPYTRQVTDADGNWDAAKSDEAAQEAALWCARFAERGQTVVSPIAQAVEMVNCSGRLDPLDEVFWTGWCRPMLRGCQSVIVPPIEGWQRSRGVWTEVCYALKHNCPVYLIAPSPTPISVSGI